MAGRRNGIGYGERSEKDSPAPFGRVSHQWIGSRRIADQAHSPVAVRLLVRDRPHPIPGLDSGFLHELDALRERFEQLLARHVDTGFFQLGVGDGRQVGFVDGHSATGGAHIQKCSWPKRIRS